MYKDLIRFPVIWSYYDKDKYPGEKAAIQKAQDDMFLDSIRPRTDRVGDEIWRTNMVTADEPGHPDHKRIYMKKDALIIMILLPKWIDNSWRKLRNLFVR